MNGELSMADDLFGTDQERTFRFFLDELAGVLSNSKFTEGELFYTAQILTRYTKVPWTDGRPITAPINESTVPFAFTRTELSPYLYANLSPRVEIRDANDCENKGSHIFLMIGFFRHHIQQENNVRIYEKMAQGYYYRASRYTNDKAKSFLFGRFAESLPVWAQQCNRLNKWLFEKRFIIQLND